MLGQGRYLDAPEYGGDTVSAFALERLRYAARLQLATGLPLAAVGGSPLEPGESEGALMQRILTEEFRVPVKWVETASRNTAENAANARRLIPVGRILLVTHALHMRRARRMFERVGFEVVPAPLGYVTRPNTGPLRIFDFIPSDLALVRSRTALHEYLGLLWYDLRDSGRRG